MGAIRSDPRLVLRSIVRPVLVEPLPEPVIDALANEPHANGARIVARLTADGRLGVHRTVAFRREATHHDLSAALLEIVANPAEPLPAANACLDWLVELKEVRVIPELRRVRASLPATPFRETLDKAIADLDALPAGVRRALMHDLPPRGDEW
jgi:hypothetical protein